MCIVVLYNDDLASPLKPYTCLYSSWLFTIFFSISLSCLITQVWTALHGLNYIREFLYMNCIFVFCSPWVNFLWQSESIPSMAQGMWPNDPNTLAEETTQFIILLSIDSVSKIFNVHFLLFKLFGT